MCRSNHSSLVLDSSLPADSASFKVEGPAGLRLSILARRSLRLWCGHHLVADELISFRHGQREMELLIFLPVTAGPVELRAEFGPRPAQLSWVDEQCPSRNRPTLEKALLKKYPDECRIEATWEPGAASPAVCLRFGPSQFRRDGMVWQEIFVRQLPAFVPLERCLKIRENEEHAPRLFLSSSVAPNLCHEARRPGTEKEGRRRFHLPVCAPGTELPPARTPGRETRLEPMRERVGTVEVLLEDGLGQATFEMPVFESVGKHAPVCEYRNLPPPQIDTMLEAAPALCVPDSWRPLTSLYEGAWRMLQRLWRIPVPESGLPGPYLGTAAEGFSENLFVWDTSFTTLASAYAHRVFPCLASFDCLYARQEDGGYLHREGHVGSNLPMFFEPDFSPNPPLMALVELCVARLTGDRARLERVYPLLVEQFAWLKHNRRLDNGTYWTTGLANGLDNSPSLGEGYPCLTAQMAHFAESLAEIAHAIGSGEAARWLAEKDGIAHALNEHLWDPIRQIYATSLSGGGHNPHKVVTAFWPLWAGVVPEERRDHLVAHALDKSSFNRPHPLPSLAADSPKFAPQGDYWLGSVWIPTNFAAVKGLWRSGAREVARELALRHLHCMAEDFARTGVLWENYCSEKIGRGSNSTHDYSWTAASPIALFLEIVLGLEPDALSRTLRWTPMPKENLGVQNYPLGPVTLSLMIRPAANGEAGVLVNTDMGFTLEIEWHGAIHRFEIPAGSRSVQLPQPL